ncbi:MAG: hypothetical protein KDE27_19080, partial [Planctomycetes bacterium]|nr:hypothetical protein [Planctomycetota bacterium]
MLTALRLLALLTLLAFALAVVDPLGDGYAEMPATTATAELSELPPDAAATRALAAAALAGPRAIELELRAALPDPELP